MQSVILKCMDRKLDDVLQDLIPLAEEGKITRFLNSAEDVDKLGGLVEDIRDAMMDYQVCPQKFHTDCVSHLHQTSLQQDIYNKSCRLIVRLTPHVPDTHAVTTK